MSNMNDGGQAFPCLERGGSGLDLTDGGMTLRQYAAIKLRVPDSGTDWLDEMIRTSQRDYFAAKAMQGLMGRNWEHINSDAEIISTWAASAYGVADAMLKAREK